MNLDDGKVEADRRGSAGRRRRRARPSDREERSKPCRSPTRATSGRSSTTAIKADLDYLKTVEDGEIIVTSRTLDDKQWTVAFLLDDGPVKIYLYDREPEQKATFLFQNRDDLDDYRW